MKNKLVSVCIPVYKSEDTIKSAIESVLVQTYKNIELIVVDNCSPDTTWQIIDSFDDPRIKKYRNDTNLGMLGNWNKCLEYVSGYYIHFLCGDDKISPDCIELKVKAMEQEEDIALAFSASDVVNESGKKLMTRRFAKTDCVVDGVKLAKKSFVSGRNIYGEPSNVLFKTALLEKTGNFSEDTLYAATEWDMWIKLSCSGKVAFIAKSLMIYRIS